MHWRFAVPLAAILTWGCAGKPPAATPPPDERQSISRAAQLAFAQDQYGQAATLYQAALELALAADDARSIIDTRFNLALTETYLGRYTAALDQVDRADAERARRGLGADPELQLLRATIHYRAGDDRAAASVLSGLLQVPGLSQDTSARAHFVAGLIAADRADPVALADHLAAIPEGAAPAVAADRLELSARLAALRGDAAQALDQFDQLVEQRALQRDYRGMTRALAGAGDIAETSGQSARAGAYLLRAGRSAAQRAAPEARAWLERARDLARRSGDQALLRDAETSLGALGSTAD